MGKLWLAAESSMAHVDALQRGNHHLLDEVRAWVSCAAGEGLILLDRVHHAAGGLVHLGAAVHEGLGHGQEDALEAGTAVAIFGRKICAAKVWLAIGSEKRGQGPSALPADRGDG